MCIRDRSDPQRQAIEAYGVWQEKRLYGKTSMGVARTTFLIDEKGVVEKVFQDVYKRQAS